VRWAINVSQDRSPPQRLLLVDNPEQMLEQMLEMIEEATGQNVPV
jgi:hypothetical protein